MSAATSISRGAAVLHVVHGDIKCMKCPEQAVVAFHIRLLDGKGDLTVDACRVCAYSFLDLILDKGAFGTARSSAVSS